jgi:hypothetical protein
MTNRAKDFVAHSIAKNDILMINMLTYYLATRPLEEMLFDTIANTLKHDRHLKSAIQYFEILPPISQSNEDMAYALVSFINALFNKEQINSMNNHSAIVFLNDVIKSNLE